MAARVFLLTWLLLLQASALSSLSSRAPQGTPRDAARTVAAQQQATAMSCVADCRRAANLTAEQAANVLGSAATTQSSWNAAEQSFAACVAKCGQAQGFTRDEIAAMFDVTAAKGKGGGGGGGTPAFTCKFGESTCSCSGFFDCQNLEKSGCCAGPIDSCSVNKNGKEVCTCTVSKKCS